MSTLDPNIFEGRAKDDWLDALQLTIAGSGDTGLEWAGRLGHATLNRALVRMGIQPNSADGVAWHDFLDEVAESWDELFDKHTSGLS